jgi:hypothetical protein
VHRHPFVALLAATVAATSSFGAVSAAPANVDTAGDPDVAVHGSDTLVLAEDWGTAAACIELGDVAECFDTEADLLAAHGDVLGSGSRRSVGGGASAAAVASSCSSSLRLYNATSYGGAILFLTSRGTVHNLADYGFDNATSSYRVGGCPAALFSLAHLGGGVYPGYTGPWAQSPTMAAGWNNAVSSAYIY